MITFRDVDKDNFQAAISLEVHENQKCFMEDNLFSIAECAFEKDFRTKVVYSDGEPIGFLLYYFVKDDPDYVFLHRYMIDKDQQGKGLGRAALEASMDLFKEEYPSIGCVELMHYP
ncbi:MAG: GNAT family N-acetyltransferase, partial [Clostridiales bacterium]|nr:GNAT family N-acetyltransferase [Clostridiales bacterium]